MSCQKNVSERFHFENEISAWLPADWRIRSAKHAFNPSPLQ